MHILTLRKGKCCLPALGKFGPLLLGIAVMLLLPTLEGMLGDGQVLVHDAWLTLCCRSRLMSWLSLTLMFAGRTTSISTMYLQHRQYKHLLDRLCKTVGFNWQDTDICHVCNSNQLHEYCMQQFKWTEEAAVHNSEKYCDVALLMQETNTQDIPRRCESCGVSQVLYSGCCDGKFGNSNPTLLQSGML